MARTSSPRTPYKAEVDLSGKFGYFVMAGVEPQTIVLCDGTAAHKGVLVDHGSYGVGDHIAVATGVDDEPDVIAAEDLVFGDEVGSDAEGKASKTFLFPAGKVVRGALAGELATVRLYAPKAVE